MSTTRTTAEPAPSPDGPALEGPHGRGRFTDETLSPTELRGVRRLGDAWQTTPLFYLERDCDATSLLDRYARLRTDLAPLKASLTGLLLSRVATVLRRHPRLNSEFRGGTRRLFDDINICVAVATQSGLTVPVIRSVDRLSAREIAVELERVIEAAHSGKLKLPDVTGGTFTITNLGMFGIDRVIPVINPPHAAILGIGRIRDQLVADAGTPVVRPTLSLTLTVDHRVVDGAAAAAFLQDLADTIEAG
jgi:pyruvate dehydrogenase E2 component (dihydrolipoamide acetyltransferase)